MATFDWIPLLDGKYMTYYQIGALIFSAINLLFAILCFITYLILCKLSAAQQRKLFPQGSKIQKWKKLTLIATFVWLSFIPLVCSALDVIGLIQGMVGMFTVYLLCIYVINGTISTINLSNHSEIQMNIIGETQNTANMLQKQSLRFIQNSLRGKTSKKVYFLALFFSIALPLVFYKTCISFYNEQIGYTSRIFGPAFNTYWTRLFELHQACPPGPPCHVYATIPEDPTTAFFLNVHTYAGIQTQVKVHYRELFSDKTDAFLTVIAQSYTYSELQWMASRKIHSALLANLKPNTKYLLKIEYDNQFYSNAIYKTLPADGKTNITMINGGDSGYTQASHNLSQLVVNYKPDIIFMGGDIAYDNNIPSCAYTWDFFLNMIEGISNQVGYIIPLVLSVGNHDVGINQLSGINISLDHTAYFKYFPQQFDRDLTGNITEKVPPINTRRSFNHYRFGNIDYITLDSGYIHGFDGYQKAYLEKVLSNSKGRVKFVNYHVPIYSICERFDKNPQRFLYALFHWIPLFDSYKVMTAFQNHVHSFKRTKPLKSSQPAQNGTVYVGDGAYGAVLSMLCKPDATMDIFQTFKNKNNVWISKITEKVVYHKAINSHGQLLDQFTQLAEAYQ